MIYAPRLLGKQRLGVAVPNFVRMSDDAPRRPGQAPLPRRERELPESQLSRASNTSSVARCIALALAAIAAPLLLAKLDSPLLSSSYGRSYARFELLGATGALALLFIAGSELRRRAGRPRVELLPVVLPLLICMHFLFLVSEHSRKPFDYDCYEYAGRAILQGEDPYLRGLIYLYPPLTAQLFAKAHLAVEHAGSLLGLAPEPEAVWGAVFYFYQCAQLLLIVLAYHLGVRFARGVGVATAPAHWLVAGLLLFDYALLRTLRHGQINLWILDLSLLGILLAQRAPLLSGVAIAFAAHLKLYPLILLVPLAVVRRWQAMAWTIAGFAAIAFVQTDFGRTWTLWEQYLGFASSGVRGEIAFRNNSLHSIFFNAIRFTIGDPRNRYRGEVDFAVMLASLAFVLWFLIRVFSRARESRARARALPDASAAAALASSAYLGHAADALAFALLLSPSVWEHHYVLAIPLAIWAVATRWGERSGAVVVGIFLMLALPSLDVFPLSYHRIAGMLLLLLLTPSRSLPNSWCAASSQSRASHSRIRSSVSSLGSTITRRSLSRIVTLGRKHSM